MTIVVPTLQKNILSFLALIAQLFETPQRKKPQHSNDMEYSKDSNEFFVCVE